MKTAVQNYIRFLNKSSGFRWEAHQEEHQTPWGKRFRVTSYLDADGIETIGVGNARTPSDAIIISMAEAFERWSVGRFFLPDSNGCAIHFNKSKADGSARLELVERDAFFCHFLTRTSPAFIEQIQFDKDAVIQIYSMSTALPKLSCCLSVMTNKQKSNMTLGLSAASSWNSAVRKAVSESQTSWSIKDFKSTSPQELINKMSSGGLIGPMDHHYLSQNSEAIKVFLKFLKAKKRRDLPIVKKRSPLSHAETRYHIQTTEFDLQKTFLKNSGLRFVQATCDELQSPFWGLPKPLFLNQKRLKAFDANFKDSRVPWDVFHLFA